MAKMSNYAQMQHVDGGSENLLSLKTEDSCPINHCSEVWVLILLILSNSQHT